MPSHAADAQTLAASAVHAVLPVCGAPFTGEQVPTEPVTSHASHWPPHARSQHTPSAQTPVPHSASALHSMPAAFAHVPFFFAVLHASPAAQTWVVQQTPSVQYAPVGQLDTSVHASPRDFVAPGTHAPALQTKPLAQCVSVVQFVRHADASHA